jgi:hypothetical protein
MTPDCLWLLDVRSQAISNNHQIFSDDDLALKILGRRRSPRIVRDAVDSRDQMRQYEGLDPRLLRDTADILDRRVVGVQVCHQFFKLDRPAFGDLVAQPVPLPATGKCRVDSRDQRSNRRTGDWRLSLVDKTKRHL